MKQMLLILCGYFATVFSVNAQNFSPPFNSYDSSTVYRVIDLQGRQVYSGVGHEMNPGNLADGLYVVYPNRIVIVILDGVVRCYQNGANTHIEPTDPNTKCVSSTEPAKPFYDSVSLMYYLHGRIDHLTSIKEQLIEITRFATEFYPQSNHGNWVNQSWMYTFDQVVDHFLQADSMGMCGDQATFLGNFFYRLLGIRTCSISIAMNTSGTNGVDTLNNGHVQLLAEIPQSSGAKLWAIFDSQNGVVYRDAEGALIDFRDIFYRVKRPYADELAPVGRFYNEWPCLGREYEWPFPFEGTQLYYRESAALNQLNHRDTITSIGERKLSFVMQDKFWGSDYRIIAQSHGIATDTMDAKELADIIPVMTVGIYETTHYGSTGIESNIVFAQEVRQILGLPGLVWNGAPVAHFRRLASMPH